MIKIFVVNWPYREILISSKTWGKTQEEKDCWWTLTEIYIKRYWEIVDGFRLLVAWWRTLS